MTLAPCQASPHRQQRGLPPPGGVLDNALTGDAGGTATEAQVSRYLQ